MPKSKVYQSVTKRSRRLELHVLPKTDKYISRRPYSPGQRGATRRSKPTDYNIQLTEKQRAKFIYGLRERQFRRLYNLAQKSHSTTGEKLLELLEMRFDNIVYRARMARTRRQARQMVGHGHFLLNKNILTLPSYSCKKGDIIEPAKKDGFKFHNQEPVSWIDVDDKKIVSKIKKIPTRAELPLDLDEQLIVEYYSR